MTTPITPIRIPLDLKEKIKTIAEMEGTNLSAWVIEKLKDSVDPYKINYEND